MSGGLEGEGRWKELIIGGVIGPIPTAEVSILDLAAERMRVVLINCQRSE